MNTREPIVIASLNRKLPGFTGANCTGPGLVAGYFDLDSGEIALTSGLPGVDNPGFLAVHPTLPCIYVATEMHDWEEGVVTSAALDPANTRLTYLNKQPSLGNCTSHVSVDGTGRFLLATNYSIMAADVLPGMSAVVFPIRPDGSLAPAVSSVKMTGEGPVAARQGKAHAHCVLATPDNRYVIVADLGADCLRSIPFDARTGRLDAEGMKDCRLRPGSGPRHFIIHPDGSTVYSLNELASTLTTLRLGPGGVLDVVDEVSTRRGDKAGHNDASDLAISPDGRFIYAANRGDDTLATFRVREDGTVEPAGRYSSCGHWPRNLCMHPNGSRLLVSNQYGSNIAVLAVGSDGSLSLLRTVDLDSPMCIVFPRSCNSSYVVG